MARLSKYFHIAEIAMGTSLRFVPDPIGGFWFKFRVLSGNTMGAIKMLMLLSCSPETDPKNAKFH
jgi:hypothetical protein